MVGEQTQNIGKRKQHRRSPVSGVASSIVMCTGRPGEGHAGGLTHSIMDRTLCRLHGTPGRGVVALPRYHTPFTFPAEWRMGREVRSTGVPMALDPHIVKTLKGVSTATITTVMLKKGLRNLWIRGAMPLKPNQERLVGPAFTLRFIPAREDLATPNPGAIRFRRGPRSRRWRKGTLPSSTRWA